MKSYQASFLTTILSDQKSTTKKKKKNNCKTHQHVEAKQHPTNQPMAH